MSAGSATPRAAQTPSFHGRPGGTTGHARMPTAAGLTACQMSTYGCPVTSTCGEFTAGDDPALLRAGHQVVDQHAEPARRARAERGDLVLQRRRCRPAAPPPRPRSAGRRPRSARPGRRRGCPRPRCGWPWPPGRVTPATATEPLAVRVRRWAGRRRRGRPAQGHRLAVEQERGRQQREVAALAEPVLQHDRAHLEADHRAAEAGVGVLHDQVRFGVHLGRRPCGAASRRPARPPHTSHAGTLAGSARPAGSRPTRAEPTHTCARSRTACERSSRVPHRARSRQGAVSTYPFLHVPRSGRDHPRDAPVQPARGLGPRVARRPGALRRGRRRGRRRRGAPRRRRPRHLDRRATARGPDRVLQAAPRPGPAGAAGARRPARPARPRRVHRRRAGRGRGRDRRRPRADPRGAHAHVRLRHDVRDRAVAHLRAARPTPRRRCRSPSPRPRPSSTALAEATNTLARLDIAQWRPELAGALAAIRKPDSANELPPGFDPRARRLFARASVLDRVLALADVGRPGRRGQRLRGAGPRRGAAATGRGLPGRARRRLQRAPHLGPPSTARPRAALAHDAARSTSPPANPSARRRPPYRAPRRPGARPARRRRLAFRRAGCPARTAPCGETGR